MILRHFPLDLFRWNSWVHLALVCTTIFAVLAVLPGHKTVKWNRHLYRWDKISEYDRVLAHWLANNSDPSQMILSTVWPENELQAKTGHPVLMESETLWLMTYMPSLAAPIGMMVQDLFGIDYSDSNQLKSISRDGHLPTWSRVWLEAWKKRTLADWQALSQKYGFSLVFSPAKTRLDLPVSLPGPLWTLYSIPRPIEVNPR
jgi:hypothetical protein